MKSLLKGIVVIGISATVLIACSTEDEASNNNEPDVVTTASIVNDSDAFLNAVSEDGEWIIATLDDISIEDDVIIAGQFHQRGDQADDIYRKLALYEQDEDRNITETHTLSVSTLTVQSENLLVQGGTIDGDVLVEENGFTLHETATIDGNLIFANADFEASATVDGDVTGSIEVE
ncbi:polymer-forming cytoskeletal protein [Evansella cellulosilytica]|uniref:Putative lipoprotein n=1 Tax=Evansella cellulosilytica (strain ATCC 21833 / DSM 2522 / FERM P-1141 / JCM 9156 / N-4) TaxID=649639 RepID=E6TSR1_EVAC2|nr:polymer-forming cytoskeletal protein [Evansella cellulosilytica]ADU29569.1 putative lipoprotein [Evansella cellulosilytica DSM 2522]